MLLCGVNCMKIKEVKEKYPDYKISYIPKKDFLIGISETATTIKVTSEDTYEDIFIARKKNKYWILYINRNFMTGHFNSKREAVTWFRKGGR